MNKKEFLSALQEIVLNEVSARRVSMQISSSIERLRTQLKKKRLSFKTHFLAPDPEDKYGDFGSLEIGIDLGIGRAKNNSIRSIEKFVIAWANRTGVLKFFNFVGSSQTGQHLSVEFELKQKYIEFYMGNKNELPVDVIDINNTGTDYEVLPKSMKLL